MWEVFLFKKKLLVQILQKKCVKIVKYDMMDTNNKRLYNKIGVF